MRSGKTPYPNVLLIVIDSLRADDLDIYGGSIGLAHINNIGSGGVVFENAYSTWNTTDQSLTTILTGKYPQSHGIIHHGDKIEAKDLVTLNKTRTKNLAEILRQYGYKTFAVDWMGRWFKRGFDYYDTKREKNITKRILIYLKYILGHRDIFLQYTDGKKFSIPSLKDAKGVIRTFLFTKQLAEIQNASFVTDLAIEQIRKGEKGNFFLFLHYWDTHTPYHCPREYQSYRGSDRKERLIGRYFGATKYIDEQLGRLFRELKGRNLWDNTIIIITADHGESLTEHDIFFDHHGLYEATIHVPLILRYPAICPKAHRRKGFVQHTDLLPTILGSLNIDAEEFHFDGTSLIPLIENNVPGIRPFAYSEESYVQKKRAIRTERYKYICATDGVGYCSYCHRIHGGPEELYDLKDDPFERVNIVEQNPSIRKDLKQKLDDFVSHLTMRRQREEKQGDLVGFDKETATYGAQEEEEIKRRLQSLGYVD
jgi:arylsulfatase A-like enzyme